MPRAARPGVDGEGDDSEGGVARPARDGRRCGDGRPARLPARARLRPGPGILRLPTARTRGHDQLAASPAGIGGVARPSVLTRADVRAVSRPLQEFLLDERREQQVADLGVKVPEPLYLPGRQAKTGNLKVFGAYERQPLGNNRHCVHATRLARQLYDAATIALRS